MLVSNVHQSDSVICLCIFQVVLYNFVCLFLAVLGLCCCARAFSSAEQGLFFLGVCRFLLWSRVLGAWASVVVAQGL